MYIISNSVWIWNKNPSFEKAALKLLFLVLLASAMLTALITSQKTNYALLYIENIQLYWKWITWLGPQNMRYWSPGINNFVPIRSTKNSTRYVPSFGAIAIVYWLLTMTVSLPCIVRSYCFITILSLSRIVRSYCFITYLVIITYCPQLLSHHISCYYHILAVMTTVFDSTLITVVGICGTSINSSENRYFDSDNFRIFSREYFDFSVFTQIWTSSEYFFSFWKNWIF